MSYSTEDDLSPVDLLAVHTCSTFSSPVHFVDPLRSRVSLDWLPARTVATAYRLASVLTSAGLVSMPEDSGSNQWWPYAVDTLQGLMLDHRIVGSEFSPGLAEAYEDLGARHPSDVFWWVPSGFVSAADYPEWDWAEINQAIARGLVWVSVARLRYLDSEGVALDSFARFTAWKVLNDAMEMLPFRECMNFRLGVNPSGRPSNWAIEC